MVPANMTRLSFRNCKKKIQKLVPVKNFVF